MKQAKVLLGLIVLCLGLKATDTHAATTTSVPFSIDFTVDDDNYSLIWIYDAGTVQSTHDTTNEDLSKRGIVWEATTTQSITSVVMNNPGFACSAGYYRIDWVGEIIGATETGILSYSLTANGETPTEDEYVIEDDGVTHHLYFSLTEESTVFMQFTLQGTMPAGSMARLSSFSISKVGFLPDLATDVKVAGAGTDSYETTVSWTNPDSESYPGVTSPDLTEAVIYRDGTEVGRVTEGLTVGATSSFTDTSIDEPGRYKYSVEIYNTNGKSDKTATTVLSPWIGEALEVPYTAGASQWATIDTDGTTWTATDDTTLSISTTADGVADYAVSPLINLEHATVSDVTFKARLTSGAGNTVYLTIGDSETDASTQEIITSNTIVAGNDWTNVKITIRPDNSVTTPKSDGAFFAVPAGNKFLCLLNTMATGLEIKDFKISENPVSSVADITADLSVKVANDKLTLSAVADRIAIVDLSGKTVLTASAVNSLDLSSLSRGVYIVSATAQGKTVTSKFVK